MTAVEAPASPAPTLNERPRRPRSAMFYMVGDYFARNTPDAPVVVKIHEPWERDWAVTQRKYHIDVVNGLGDNDSPVADLVRGNLTVLIVALTMSVAAYDKEQQQEGEQGATSESEEGVGDVALADSAGGQGSSPVLAGPSGDLSEAAS